MGKKKDNRRFFEIKPKSNLFHKSDRIHNIYLSIFPCDTVKHKISEDNEEKFAGKKFDFLNFQNISKIIFSTRIFFLTTSFRHFFIGKYSFL